MKGRKLKNYENYLLKIKSYAKAVGIKIIYNEDMEEGVYYPSTKTISISDHLPNSCEIAILLHEFGHSIDEYISHKPTRDILDDAYNAMYAEKCTPEQEKIVLDSEKRAWVFGRSIAKNLNIKLGDWYYKTKATCLLGYRTHGN